MATVRSLCSHCMLLTDGRNDIQDSTDAVIDRYLALDASEISAFVPLAPGPPQAPGAGISLRFLDAKGHSRSQFRLGETWRIVLELEMRRQTPHVIAAVGLTNLESVSLITYWSKPKDLSPGRHRAEFVCDAPLTSCDIQFTVGISSYEKTFYFMPRLGRVSISDAALHEQPVRAAGSGLLFSSSRPEIEVL
jgi:hypothetical protein